MINRANDWLRQWAVRSACIACAALVLVAGAAVARAQSAAEAEGDAAASKPASRETESDPAVRSGREALGRAPNYPWYDAESDSLRPAGFARQSQNNSNNQQTPPKQQAPSSSRSSGGSSSGGKSSSSPPASLPNTGIASTFVQGLMWLVLALVLCALVYMVIQAYLNRENSAAAKSTELDAADSRTETERVEALPFAVRPTISGLLDEARRNYEAGNYREAIIYFYSHVLVELDRAQLIRLERGKTNREYLREVNDRRPVRDVLEPTMVSFEDVFFGDHVLQREQFETCWQQLPDLERLLQTAAR